MLLLLVAVVMGGVMTMTMSAYSTRSQLLYPEAARTRHILHCLPGRCTAAYLRPMCASQFAN